MKKKRNWQKTKNSIGPNQQLEILFIYFNGGNGVLILNKTFLCIILLFPNSKGQNYSDMYWSHIYTILTSVAGTKDKVYQAEASMSLLWSRTVQIEPAHDAQPF